jgi:hypothetical protein
MIESSENVTLGNLKKIPSSSIFPIQPVSFYSRVSNLMMQIFKENQKNKRDIFQKSLIMISSINNSSDELAIFQKLFGLNLSDYYFASFNYENFKDSSQVKCRSYDDIMMNPYKCKSMLMV